MTLSRLRITGGETGGSGGGILALANSNLVVTDSEIVDNIASSGGGIWSDGALTVNRSTIAFNEALGHLEGSAPAVGGGLGLGPGPEARLTNTTISRNAADGQQVEQSGQGGGIYTQRSMLLENVSIIGNEAQLPVLGANQGGGLFQAFTPGSGLRTTARNTLLALNTIEACGGTAGEFMLDSNNGLLDELDRVPGPSCNADTTDNILVNAAAAGVDAALLDNGGLTRTHALLAGSPRDQRRRALCPGEDQRAFAPSLGPGLRHQRVRGRRRLRRSPPAGGGGGGWRHHAAA